jgi:hypothetical protein
MYTGAGLDVHYFCRTGAALFGAPVLGPIIATSPYLFISKRLQNANYSVPEPEPRHFNGGGAATQCRSCPGSDAQVLKFLYTIND